MSMRKTRREAFWRGVVREQSGSGLSIRAFCRARRLSEPSFYSWRRELRRRDEEQPEGEPTRHEPTPIGPAPVERTRIDPSLNKPMPNERTRVAPTPNDWPPRFVPVSLRQAAGRVAAEPAIEMVLPSGSVVRMPADTEQAAALIAQVERRLC